MKARVLLNVAQKLLRLIGRTVLAKTFLDVVAKRFKILKRTGKKTWKELYPNKEYDY
jgi:hypothetical protein